jgi:hypothetical protein
MNEDRTFKEIDLGEHFGDVVIKVNGLRVEIHADGSGNINKIDEDERHSAFRIVLEEVQEELMRLRDPANVRLPQFESKGYSWSLLL